MSPTSERRHAAPVTPRPISRDRMRRQSNPAPREGSSYELVSKAHQLSSKTHERFLKTHELLKTGMLEPLARRVAGSFCWDGFASHCAAALPRASRSRTTLCTNVP
jgi:hypothetical protein